MSEAAKKTQRLSAATISQLDSIVARPTYDPMRHGTGMVHLGVGAFHRAHQAVYTDTAIAKHGGDWRICGVSLRSATAADQLNPQDGLFTVASKAEFSSEYRVIGSVERVIAAASDSQAALRQMAGPQTRIVSLTITEKGYCRDAATDSLAVEHPDIVADLKNPSAPRSAVGCIVEALRLRCDVGCAPFTVLSCDNLSGNGSAARQVVIDYAELVDARLASWIKGNVTFPSTMVDRICPATTDNDRREADAILGLNDRGLVVAEPFSQWVIEDEFCNGRPQWEEGGAEIVADVSPYETAKLRLLNGSHSAIAYVGLLAGFSFVHDAINDSVIAAYVRNLMSEAETTLQVPDAFRVWDYRESVLARFRNSGVAYSTAQVATDGSQKLPQRLIAPAIERIKKGQAIEGTALAIAAWIRFVTSEDERGKRRLTDDPLSRQLSKLPSSSQHSASEVVDAALSMSQVFDARVASNIKFRGSLIASLDSIIQFGVIGAIERSLELNG